MKKPLFILGMLSLCLTMVSAQFKANTHWPYLYENFSEGTIYFTGNKEVKSKLNIHLLESSLHYLQDGNIYQANTHDILEAEIGNDKFICEDGKLMKIISEVKSNKLLKLTVGDFESLLSNKGAYGASSNTQAVKDLSSLEIRGLNNPAHGYMLQEKNEGRIVPLKETYYLLLDKKMIPATKRDIEKYLNDSDKDKWKGFLKENKIKWKDEQKLALLLNYFTND